MSTELVLEPAATDGAARPSGASWRCVLPALAMLGWGGNQFTPLLLLYRHVDGYSPVQVDLFLAMYVVGLVPGFLVTGPLSDRYGRKRLVQVALALSVLASAVLALGGSSSWWMCVGRLVAGVSVAVAMVVGTAWVEELSAPPFGAPTSRSTAARRASITLTVGLGGGAGIAGVLAQWGPHPTLLPYVVHIALTVPAALVLTRAPETRTHRTGTTLRALVRDLRIPPHRRARFLRVVVPSAPWVFGAAGLAYALTPELVGDRVGGEGVAFATLLTVVTLGAGAVVQQFLPWIARRSGGRQSLVGTGLMTVGVGLCAVEAVVRSVLLAVVVGVVLGVAYGVSLVAGLVEVRTVADEDDLGGITGVFYCLTYVGFALPVALAGLTHLAGYPTLLAVLTLLCLACAVTVGRGVRR